MVSELSLLSFKTTVDFFQVVGKAQVVKGMGGFRSVVGDLSETPPARQSC